MSTASDAVERTPEDLVESFKAVLSLAEPVQRRHAEQSAESVAILEALADLDRQAHALRAQLAKHGRESLVDHLGWPGRTDQGAMIIRLTTIVPLRQGDPQWPAGAVIR